MDSSEAIGILQALVPGGSEALPADQAAALLEAVGGDVNEAAALVMEGALGQPAPSSTVPTDRLHTVLWGDQPIPDAWRNTGFRRCPDQGGILQVDGNGPCGILCAVHAVMVSMRAQGQGAPPTASLASLTEAEYRSLLRAAVVAMLSRCSQCGDVVVARWADDSRRSLAAQPATKCGDAVSDADLDTLIGPGGVAVLAGSLVMTRGEALVEQEKDMPGSSLISESLGFCTAELLFLALAGAARPLLADVALEGAVDDAENELIGSVGMLTVADGGLGDSLPRNIKAPAQPVWILHGGSHFTVLVTSAGEGGEGGRVLQAEHWNGLPPGGPRMSQFQIMTHGEEGVPEQKHFVKAGLGQVRSVVQACTEDKKNTPDNLEEWRFEVTLGDGEDDGEEGIQVNEPPVDRSHHPIPSTGKWRCAKCYEGRYKTFCFGDNTVEAGQDPICQHCGKHADEGGYSVWMHYRDLPPRVQRNVQGMYGPKILSILRSRWAKCTITHQGPAPDC